jgi:hypothetical protein
MTLQLIIWDQRRRVADRDLWAESHTMIATFLKDDDGDFNYPAGMMSLFLLFCISGMVIGLIRAFKAGRILFAWGSTFGGSVRFYVERQKNPTGFWAVATLYGLAMMLLFTLIIVICFGFLRKSA